MIKAHGSTLRVELDASSNIKVNLLKLEHSSEEIWAGSCMNLHLTKPLAQDHSQRPLSLNGTNQTLRTASAGDWGGVWQMTDFPKKPHAIRLRNEVLILKCATSFVTSVTHQWVE